MLVSIMFSVSVRGEEDDKQLRAPFKYALGGSYAGRGRLHLYVHEDDLAVRAQRQSLRLRAGSGLADHAHVLLGRERVAEVFAYDVEVLGNQVFITCHVSLPGVSCRRSAAGG